MYEYGTPLINPVCQFTHQRSKQTLGPLITIVFADSIQVKRRNNSTDHVGGLHAVIPLGRNKQRRLDNPGISASQRWAREQVTLRRRQNPLILFLGSPVHDDNTSAKPRSRDISKKFLEICHQALNMAGVNPLFVVGGRCRMLETPISKDIPLAAPNHMEKIYGKSLVTPSAELLRLPLFRPYALHNAGVSNFVPIVGFLQIQKTPIEITPMRCRDHNPREPEQRMLAVPRIPDFVRSRVPEFVQVEEIHWLAALQKARDPPHGRAPGRRLTRTPEGQTGWRTAETMERREANVNLFLGFLRTANRQNARVCSNRPMCLNS